VEYLVLAGSPDFVREGSDYELLLEIGMRFQETNGTSEGRQVVPSRLEPLTSTR
jgi:hypothetical protein